MLKKNKKKHEPRYCTLQLAKDKGGMVLPNLKDYYPAAQLNQMVWQGVQRNVARDWDDSGKHPNPWQKHYRTQ